MYAVERKEDGAFVGTVGLNNVDFKAAFTPAVEIAWRLDYGYWGKGYATEAARTVQVTAETNGRVINEPLRKGTTVSAGQELCALDRGTRDSSLAQAHAALSEAEVALANARKLAEGGYASETQILSAEAGVESARAAVAQVQRDIENLSITAPFADHRSSTTKWLNSQ